MTHTLESIIDISGDSILKSYSYLNGFLTIVLNLSDSDKLVSVKIKTDDLSFSPYYLEKDQIAFRTCRIEIQNLAEVLLLQNDIYIPSNDFGIIMKESRLRLNLAYGRKSSEVKYIFYLTGYDRLISCLLANLECIEIE